VGAAGVAALGAASGEVAAGGGDPAGGARIRLAEAVDLAGVGLEVVDRAAGGVDSVEGVAVSGVAAVELVVGLAIAQR